MNPSKLTHISAARTSLYLFRECEKRRSSVARDEIERGFSESEPLPTLLLYILQDDREAANDAAIATDITECEVANLFTYCKRYRLQWSEERVA